MRPIGRAILLGLLVPGVVVASSGDRRPEFSTCIAQCQSQRCPTSPSRTSDSIPLYITHWTCLDECKYDCMHSITSSDLILGQRIHQYYGKWPFWRLAGMQEPASVVFSLFNLWAHFRGAKSIQKRVPRNHPMRYYYLIWSLISMNAWTWSAIFHTRDLPFTEKMDYFSAALAILYAFYYTTIRLFHLYPRPGNKLGRSSPPASSWSYNGLTWLCSLAFIGHVSYLTLLPRFDYTYNMAFNLAVGLLHNALWLIYAMPSSFSLIRRFPSSAKSYRPPFATKAAVFVAITTAATALELFDFPPWRLAIDAHALWHLATVPIAYYWYSFLIEDSLDNSWRSDRI